MDTKIFNEYEQRLAKGDYQGSLDVGVQILQHYHRHYPKFDINTGLMILKSAKLCLYLDHLDAAEKHLVRGKDILVITHGKSYPLVTESLGQLEQDLTKAKEYKNVTSNLMLKQKEKLSKSG